MTEEEEDELLEDGLEDEPVDADSDDEEEEEVLASDEEQPNEASLEEILAKRAKKSDEDEPESIFEFSQNDDEPAAPLKVKTTPPKEGEFVCSSCRLVKKRSQLANAKRKLCNDCV